MVLTRVVLALAASWSAAACGSTPPPASATAETTVVARWAADDGSVVAVNVVLGRDGDPRTLPEVARSIRDQHPDARVIVTIFSHSAGPERYVIGHVPTDSGALAAGTRPRSALATFDYPGPAPSATAGAP